MLSGRGSWCILFSPQPSATFYKFGDIYMWGRNDFVFSLWTSFGHYLLLWKAMNSRIRVTAETEQDICTPNEWNWCRCLSLVSFQRAWGQWRELTCILNLLHIESVLILQYITQFNSYKNPISQNYYHYFPDEVRRLFDIKNSISEEGLQFSLFYLKRFLNSKFNYCSMKAQWGFEHIVTCKYFLRHW